MYHTIRQSWFASAGSDPDQVLQKVVVYMRRVSLLGVLLLSTIPLWSQGTIVCQTTAVPAVIRVEGVAERLGDIVLSCSGAPGREVTGNLTVFLNTTVTNRILSGSGALDAVLTVNDAIASVPAMQGGNNQVVWSGLRINTGMSGRVELRISNLRGDASLGGAPSIPSQFGPGGLLGTPITANLAFNPGGILNFTQATFTVGAPERGLYATTLTTVVPTHSGSPLPEDITFSELIRAGTVFGTTRVTEGSVSAFEPQQPQTTQGTRIMLRFSDYPADARLFAPALIAGSNAEIPTRAGDFGGTVSGGANTPGRPALVLARVLFTDSNGAGGSPASGLIGTSVFNAMTEVNLSNGSGVAVYEVINADPAAQESAQIPVFIGVPRSQSARSSTAQLQVSFAPVSTTATASVVAPVPRFVQVNAPTDCGVFADCRSYIPRLGAPPVNTDLRLTRGVGVEQRSIPLSNEGGGLMPWAATVEYRRGNGWIILDRTSANQPVLIRMTVRALADMTPGLYEATLIIDAGLAGIARYPVKLEIVEAPTSPPPPVNNRPVVTSVVHGATFETGVVARGSYVTLRGTNLGSGNVTVTFDGRPAQVVYSSSEQINVLVPSDLAGNTAQVVVTANGVASTAFSVNVAAANPGIFTPGILNQDGSVNSAANPANTGSFVQIYATGLLAPDGSGAVEAKLHDQVYTTLPYAGPAPGIPGLQQVNLMIPAGWPTMTTSVLLCTNAGGQRQCSAAVPIHIRQVQ
jgi:uncharacterized protein (TIGR03437 family)